MKNMELDGKVLAVVLWGEKDGEEEASVHTGTLRKAGASYEFFREEDGPSFNLEQKWLDRIKTVPDELKETLLNADVSLSLTVGQIPDDMDVSEFVFTGLRIPEDD